MDDTVGRASKRPRAEAESPLERQTILWNWLTEKGAQLAHLELRYVDDVKGCYVELLKDIAAGEEALRVPHDCVLTVEKAA